MRRCAGSAAVIEIQANDLRQMADSALRVPAADSGQPVVYVFGASQRDHW